MTARPVPLVRLDIEPDSVGLPYPSRAEREALLRRSLRGVDLGVWDERLVAWVAQWDDTTVRTVASWLERARLDERAAAAAEVHAQLAVMAAEWEAMPPAERGPKHVEDAYADGLLRALAVLTGRRESVGTELDEVT